MMTFEVGAVLEDAKWQVPAYCFHKDNNATDHPAPSLPQLSITSAAIASQQQQQLLLDGVLRGSLGQ